MRNMNDILRQAQVMQSKIAKLQAEMGEKTIESSSGGGMVKVVMNCKQELKSLAIDPTILETPDHEMLEDLILTAVNDASRTAKATMEREMNALTGGIHLPGVF